MIYKVCPLCGNEWDGPDFGLPNSRCSVCRISVFYETPYDETLYRIIHDTESSTIWVQWRLATNDCIVRIGVGNNARDILMPWLPFGITKEQLDKYLTLL